MTTELRGPALAPVEAALGHRFARPALLEEALTHRSATPPGRKPARRGSVCSYGYERLEFLGDRVLGLAIAEMLLEIFPDEPEGALARRLAELVRKETLAAVAGDLGLAPHIRLPAVEEPGGRGNPSLLADVCEAAIAALYLDGGFEAARRFIALHWLPRMTAAATPPKDPKTGLQEWAQARGRALPAYTLVKTDGPPHLPVFTVAVSVEGEGEARADGPSKRLAESAAASVLLGRLRPGQPI